MAAWGSTLSKRAQRGIKRGARQTTKARRSAAQTTRKRNLRARADALGTPIRGNFSPLLVRPQIQAAERARRLGLMEAALDSTTSDTPGILQRGLIGSAVYEATGDDISPAVRRLLYGTENPSAGQLALGLAPIPAVKVLRGAKAVVGAAKGAKAAPKAVAAAKVGQKARRAPKPAPPPRQAKPPRRSNSPIDLAARRSPGGPRRVPRSQAELKRAAARQYKKRRGISTKEKLSTSQGRRGSYGARAANYSTLAAAASPALPIVGVSAQRYAEAVADDPGQTLKTTARTIPAIGTALMAAPVTAAVAIKEGDTAPLGRLWDQQERYADTLRMIADPSTDSAEAKRIIQEDVGLVPLLTAGLTAAAAGRYLPIPRPSITPRQTRKTNKLQAQRQSPDFRTRARAEEKLQGRDATYRQSKEQRVRESKRAAATGERTDRQFDRDMRTGGRGKNRLDRQLERLNRIRLTDKVTVADTLQFLGREGLYGMEPRRFTREMEVRAARLVKPKREIGDTSVATRDVLDALRRNPQVASDPAVVSFLSDYATMQRNRSTERHTERTGPRQTTPDPEDIRAQMLQFARAEGIDLPEQRTPRELRGRTKVKPKEGQDIRTQIRGEAKGLRKRAGRLEAQAVALRRAGRGERAEVLDKRAAKYLLEAEVREAIVNRERRAEGLERKATRIESDNPELAAEMRAEAQALRAQHVAAERFLRDEFAGEVRERLKAKKQADPIYLKSRDVSDRGELNVMGDYPGAALPKREQRLMGQLAAQGRIDEAGAVLLENAYRGRVAMEMKRHVKTFVDQRVMKDADDQMLLLTGDRWRRLERDGKVPPGSALFPVQEFSRAFQRGAWDEAAGLIDNSTMAALREGRGMEGRKYALVPKPALVEFRDQMNAYGKGLKIVRTSARIQSLMLLASSPAWFSWQLLASPMAAAYSHPNPARWAKASKEYLADWKKVPKEDRITFQSEYGGTIADAIDFGDTQIGLRPDTVRNSDKAAGVALRSPGGRVLQAVINHGKKGGPLIQFNRRYEAEYRDLVALVTMDKEINPPRALKFIDSVAKAHRHVHADVQHLKGKSLTERLRYYNDNPDAAQRLADKVDDAMGNWNALTKHERAAGAVTIFYPFLRFSSRWMLKTYPKNNPLRAAFLLNLAQANAQELERLMGEEPSFFPDWGNIVIQAAKPTAVNMSRVAPGSNAFIEGLGTGELNLQTAARPLQPVIGVVLSALAGQDPLSGRESKRTGPEEVAAGLGGLIPAARPFARQIGPEPSVYSELFRRITGREGDLKQYLLPRVGTDLDAEGEAARASVLMDKAFGQNDSAALSQLYGMLRKYGLDPPGESPSSSSSPSSSTSSSSSAWWRSGSSSGSTSSSEGSAWWR